MLDDDASQSINGAEAGSAPPQRTLLTSVPGPRSEALTDDLARYECPAITARRPRVKGEKGVDRDPIVWRRGAGVFIEDVDGNTYLDFTSAFGVSVYGHSHPALVEALHAQAKRLMHGMGDVYPTDTKIAYAKRLAEVTPGALSQCLFGLSGSDAVESALKTARLASGRRRVLAFHGGYHGLSYGALSVTGYSSAFRAPFGDTVNQQVVHAPYPTCYRCPLGQRRESCGMACLDYVRHQLTHPGAGADDVGTVIVEPIQGRGGYYEPPAGWLNGLAEVCREADLILILDEIYTGFGRTGALFACEHEAVEPDLLCVGKAMTGGFPMSAAIGTSEVMAAWGLNQCEAIHTSTFLGNPMGCAVGLKALELHDQEDYLALARAHGETLRAGLLALQARFPDVIGDVRGRGLMQAAELVVDPQTKEPNSALSGAVMQRMLEKGVLLLPNGAWGQVMALTPPLIVEERHIEELFGLLHETFEELVDPDREGI